MKKIEDIKNRDELFKELGYDKLPSHLCTEILSTKVQPYANVYLDMSDYANCDIFKNISKDEKAELLEDCSKHMENNLACYVIANAVMQSLAEEKSEYEHALEFANIVDMLARNMKRCFSVSLGTPFIHGDRAIKCNLNNVKDLRDGILYMRYTSDPKKYSYLKDIHDGIQYRYYNMKDRLLRRKFPYNDYTDLEKQLYKIYKLDEVDYSTVNGYDSESYYDLLSQNTKVRDSIIKDGSRLYNCLLEINRYEGSDTVNELIVNIINDKFHGKLTETKRRIYHNIEYAVNDSTIFNKISDRLNDHAKELILQIELGE